MHVVEVATGKKYTLDVLPVKEEDYPSLTRKRYFFDWGEERSKEMYKAVLRTHQNIVGLVSIERIPSEWRIHIRLLTVSKENAGSGKVFENIAGCLLAYVAKLAVAEYGAFACVSLKPKNAIAQHYIETYHMKVTGLTLSLEVPEIINLIQTYDHDE